jgi:hypothetical protein
VPIADVRGEALARVLRFVSAEDASTMQLFVVAFIFDLLTAFVLGAAEKLLTLPRAARRKEADKPEL